MSIFLQIAAVFICLLMLIGLNREMKKKRLSENQAIVWLVGVIGLLIVSIFPRILAWAADLLGIWWPPASLIFFLILVIILIVFRHTVALSAMEAEIKELAMQVALLKAKGEPKEKDYTSPNQGDEKNI